MQNVYKEKRKKMKLTQTELATKLHLNQATISKWEKGKSIPDIYTLINLSEFFNCTIDELVGKNQHINAGTQPQSHENSSFDNATPAQKELVNRALESSDRVCNRVLAYMDVITDRELAADLLKFKDIDL